MVRRKTTTEKWSLGSGAEVLPASLRESRRDQTRPPTLAGQDSILYISKPNINKANAIHVRHASRNLVTARNDGR
jgi:hypothetical protein